MDTNSKAGVKSPELVQHELEVWKAKLSFHAAGNAEMIKAVLETGQTSLKTATLINGGAAAALLAVFAEWLKIGPTPLTLLMLSPLGGAWQHFMWGLGTAGVATAARYLSQAYYAAVFQSIEADPKKPFYQNSGDVFKYAAIALGVSSFILFFTGTHKVYAVITQAANYQPQKGQETPTVAGLSTPPVAPQNPGDALK